MPKFSSTKGSGLFFFSAQIPAQRLSPKEVRGRVLRTLQLFADKMKKDLERTVENWNDPAKFDKPLIRYHAGNPRIGITTDSDKWRWLNYGTSVRWALMHRDFRAKTRPGTLRSGSGQGPSEPVWRGYSMGIPQPGIEPRNWTTLVKEKYKDKVRKELRKQVLAGLRSAKGKP